MEDDGEPETFTGRAIMADTNYAEIIWRQFPNNKITADGFYTEYLAKNYADVNKTKQETGAGEITATAENVLYLPQSESIILKPDIMPIDMLARAVSGSTGRLQGDWWDMYDSASGTTMVWHGYANFERKDVAGSPLRKVLYQKNVQYQTDVGTDYQGVWWSFFAGTGRGYVKNESLLENQGVVVWVDENKLPENEEGTLTIYLYKNHPEKTDQVINGIKVTIKGDSDILVQHVVDINDTGKRPAQYEVYTQSQKGTVSVGKDIVEWSGKTKVYTLLIHDKYILFGINGLDNPFVMECQNYAEGVTPDGLTYPVILRDDSTLYIQGKGQATVGFKKLSYYKSASIKIPEVKTGYELNAPKQSTRVKKSDSETVEAKYYKDGATADNYKVYGEISLSGTPINSETDETGDEVERLKVYNASHTEKTPTFNKIKAWDDQVRSTEEVDLPDDMRGKVVGYTQSASAGENNSITDFTATLSCYGDFTNMYADLLTKKQLCGEVYRKLTTEESNVSDGKFIFTEPEVKIGNFGKISISLTGQELALSSLNNSAGYMISYDDRKNVTDISAMQNVCAIAKLTFSSNVTGTKLPETIENEEGAFTFQPNTTFLEMLQKLASVQGYNLYTLNGVVYYNTTKLTTDFTVGRGEDYLTENIALKHRNLYKSRVYVIGKAGRTQTETVGSAQEKIKRGEKLVGIWRDSSIEKEVGYTPFVKIDEGLINWAMIQNEGQKLWSRFNERPYEISFDIVDATEYYNDIKLFNVFLWKDSVYSALHDKRFLITGYSKDLSLTDCTANIKAVII